MSFLRVTNRAVLHIGEWHTYPFGPNTLRPTDAAAIRKCKKAFDGLQTPLQDFLMILTRTISFLMCIRAGRLLAGGF